MTTIEPNQPEIPDWMLRDHKRLANPLLGIPILARSPLSAYRHAIER